MKTSRPSALPRRLTGFSLVEVTVAIGIFAFVVVGIIGLLPTALRLRADSARDTRAALIAKELMSSVKASPSITNVIMRDGPGLEVGNNQWVNLSNTADYLVLGYPAQTSVPFFLWGGSRNVGTPQSAWEGGVMPPGAQDNGVETLARVWARPAVDTNGVIVPKLYHISVEVRSPANVPLTNASGHTNTPPVTFTSYYRSP